MRSSRYGSHNSIYEKLVVLQIKCLQTKCIPTLYGISQAPGFPDEPSTFDDFTKKYDGKILETFVSSERAGSQTQKTNSKSEDLWAGTECTYSCAVKHVRSSTCTHTRSHETRAHAQGHMRTHTAYVPSHDIPCCMCPFSFVPYHTTSYHTMPYHMQYAMPLHTVPYIV